MLLTAAFWRPPKAGPCPRKVLNISSGLGRRAMASQAAYCAAKAGMDHFTRCVALDEAIKPHGAKVCSLAPGVIDTDMQVQLRGADPAAFPTARISPTSRRVASSPRLPTPLPACSPGWSAQTSAPTPWPMCAMPEHDLLIFS